MPVERRGSAFPAEVVRCDAVADADGADDASTGAEFVNLLKPGGLGQKPAQNDSLIMI
jgi:hypothetical protein